MQGVGTLVGLPTPVRLWPYGKRSAMPTVNIPGRAYRLIADMEFVKGETSDPDLSEVKKALESAQPIQYANGFTYPVEASPDALRALKGCTLRVTSSVGFHEREVYAARVVTKRIDAALSRP